MPLEWGKPGSGVLNDCFSFNAREVGGAPKVLALKRLVQACAPDLIMVHETMCVGNKASG